MADRTFVVEEITGRKALDVGIGSVEQALEELKDGRGYTDRGSVEMLLRSALSFLSNVLPEAPDANCCTTADGGCVGSGCMHDPKE